jgi:hypothetical protein
MPITFLGQAALNPLLTAAARIRLVNATPAEDGLTIVAAALARHDGGGGITRETSFGLDLRADESLLLDALAPSALPPKGAELLLRVNIDPGDGSTPVFVDVYLHAEITAPATAAPQGFEFGVRRHDGVIESDEVLIGGFASLAAYGRVLG